MSFEFDDALTAPQIEQMVADIEHRIHAAHPEVTSLFIKPQNPQQYRDTVRERFGENVAEATRAPQTPVVGSLAQHHNRRTHSRGAPPCPARP